MTIGLFANLEKDADTVGFARCDGARHNNSDRPGSPEGRPRSAGAGFGRPRWAAADASARRA